MIYSYLNFRIVFSKNMFLKKNGEKRKRGSNFNRFLPNKKYFKWKTNCQLKLYHTYESFKIEFRKQNNEIGNKK